MPKSRDPFGVAYDRLRGRVLAGVYPPGASVVILDEAARLNLSTTPVREALSRLCGEGLLDQAPRAGYRTPGPDPALLTERLWLRQHCLEAAILMSSVRPPLPPTSFDPQADDGRRAARGVLAAVIRGSANRALMDAFKRIDAQLSVVGHAETLVLDGLQEEARELTAAYQEGSAPRLAASLADYHRRRAVEAARILLAAESAGPQRDPETKS